MKGKLVISVDEALEQILEKIKPLLAEEIALVDAVDNVLAEDIFSNMNIPPFNNSAMDGYAVRSQDVKIASKDDPVELQVLGDLAAGYVSDLTIGKGQAIRIMTGAPMPTGADCVVMVEKTEKTNGGVNIFSSAKENENVRFSGEDIAVGEKVLWKGKVLRAADIGILASLGYPRVKVFRKPVAAILSTGDELVDVDQPLADGKIRNSNAYALASLVIESGGTPVILGIAKDTVEDVSSKIKEGLLKADLLISSGGVSVGDYDMVKNVLNSLGVMLFWKVAMKPAKPLAFGIIDGKPMFGLPGNPTSSMVSFEQFIRPALLKMSGRTKVKRTIVKAIVENDIKKKPGRRNFIRVELREVIGRYYASISGGQGSGMMKAMSRAQGLLIVPEESAGVAKGDILEVQLLYPEDVKTIDSQIDYSDVKKTLENISNDNSLKCAEALLLASKLEVTPGEIGQLSNELKIKIKECLLGCFK